MCIRCSGGYGPGGNYIIGDGYTQRHTVPPPDPFDPLTIIRERRRIHPPPVPVEHGTVRGIRSHKRKQEDLCDACDEFDWTPAYWRELREQSLATTNRKIGRLLEDARQGMDIDRDLLAYYERKRAKLEKQLSGEEEKPAKKQDTEPTEALHVRIPVSQAEGLRERAGEQDTTVSAIVRQALDAFLLL